MSMTVVTQNQLKHKINRLDLGEKLTQSESRRSLLETHIKKLPIPTLSIFLNGDHVSPVSFKHSTQTLPLFNQEAVSEKLPVLTAQQQGVILEAAKQQTPIKGKKVAVLFSGGPASGGHNVVAGLKKVLGSDNTLYGIKAGPKGLLAGDLFEVSEGDAESILNTGGFDFLGSDRTKIKTKEQFDLVKQTVQKFSLDGLVVVGGDDSNTNAAFLAEALYPLGCSVVGVPKTIDGDLQAGSWLPISFGFDTATKIYAELVGNILADTPSSRKYWHFIKLMGRSASHVALEVALQTKPPIALISEEVAQKKQTLEDIVTSVSTTILRRAAKGIYYGAVVLPEGLIEFVPELNSLIKDLNILLGKYDKELQILSLGEKMDFIQKKLEDQQAHLLSSLPETIKKQLLLERDSHGNLQVSQIPTEQLLIDMVKVKIKELRGNLKVLGELSSKETERINQFKFATNSHFLGYEGRCGAPTRFDAAYTFNLGLIAGSLILDGRTGYMAALTDLDSEGRAIALPLTGLMTLEARGNEQQMVIEKALVDIQSPAFVYFASRRDQWALNDLFTSPGPIQLWGPTSLSVPLVIALNHGYKSFEFSLGKEVQYGGLQN
jgi:pyrophosphate--fructose-6-phosphate 1-phosphotransferase